MQNGNGHESEMVFSAKQLSDVLNLTPRRVQQLAEDGIIVKASRGKYFAFESIKRYVQTLQEKRGDSDKVDYYTEHALLEKAKREKAELELAKRKNQLHDAADVELVLTNMLTTFRNRVMAIPPKVAPKVIGVKNLAEINQVIQQEILEALTELSEYDPAMFAGGDDIEESEEDFESVP